MYHSKKSERQINRQRS